MEKIEKFTKIKVRGKIHLGYRKELLQIPEKKDASIYRSGGKGAEHKYDKISNENFSSIGDSLNFKIAEDKISDLYIENAGLVTSYGIFGAPGSGKTVLLLYLLEQLFNLNSNNNQKKYGALILDPKASLVDDITILAQKAGRLEDLVIVGNGQEINAIGTNLVSYELGEILVLAARSAGIGASDPFWFQEWSNLFSSCINILRTDAKQHDLSLEGVRPVTLKLLLDSIFDEVTTEGGNQKERKIQQIARRVSKYLKDNDIAEKDVLMDIQQVNKFFTQDYVGTIEAFITRAFGMFRKTRNLFYSDDSIKIRPNFYEDIIEKGKIVIVSISPSEPVLAKTLCTLIKCLFQRTVLSRGEDFIKNKIRPVVIACDEYSEIASEIPGQSMGDGQFLALARQYGCMAIFATQSVNVLQASPLKDTWKSVFSNFAAKIYMRLADNETAEEATKLAGESEWKILSRGSTFGQQGRSTSKQRELRERKNLPPIIMTQVLKTGQAVVVGSLDGGLANTGTYFLSVPYKHTKPISKLPLNDNVNKNITCLNCKYHNKPIEFKLTSSPKANLKWEEAKQERRGEEQRRVDENYQFHYKPEFFDWCSKGVPTTDEMKRLSNLHLLGDKKSLNSERTNGLLFTIDPAKGIIEPVYPVCIKRNSMSNCGLFEPKVNL